MKGEKEEAFRYLEASYSIRLSLLGEDHVDTMKVKNTMEGLQKS